MRHIATPVRGCSPYIQILDDLPFYEVNFQATDKKERRMNILEHIGDEDTTVSTSSLINEVVGVCPKCGKPFGFASAADLNVYYCDDCCVTQPLPDSN